MNKQELIAIVAEENELSKAQAGRIIDSVFDAIVKSVAKGDGFQLIGFGTFKAAKRAAREGRNPSTGARSRSRPRRCRSSRLALPSRPPLPRRSAASANLRDSLKKPPLGAVFYFGILFSSMPSFEGIEVFISA